MILSYIAQLSILMNTIIIFTLSPLILHSLDCDGHSLIECGCRRSIRWSRGGPRAAGSCSQALLVQPLRLASGMGMYSDYLLELLHSTLLVVIADCLSLF